MEEIKSKGKEIEINEEDFLYNKQVHCPNCSNEFNARSVKKEGAKIRKRHSDLYIEYYPIITYFYDVILCPLCGYANLRSDFDKLRDYQVAIVQSKISNNWNPKHYPSTYNVDIAIERYKMALLNSMVLEGKDSQKAILCLKLTWMYRYKNDPKGEIEYMKKAVSAFIATYEKEDIFPVYGMDSYSICYIIGELNRRLGQEKEAISWLGKVITASNASKNLKELARDQKELIKPSN